MKHSEAIVHLNHMMVACQRARSIIMETSPELSENELHLMNKWLFGEKNLVWALNRTLEWDSTGEKELTPSEFYNFMSIAYRDQMIQIASLDYDFARSMLPEPDRSWIMGWDPEEAVVPRKGAA